MRPTVFVTLLAGAAACIGDVNPAHARSNANNDEIRAIVSEMMSDAQTRSSLLQSGAMAGHDGKFFLGSSDGNFRLNIGGQMQFRYTMNIRDDGDFDTDGDGVDDTTVDEFEHGFSNRRMRLEFDGHVFSRDLTYKVQTEFNRNGGAGRLLDAFVGYNLGDGWKLQWGQFKLPFLREELVSSKYQLAADRSFTNNQFSQGRSQAIQVSYSEDMFRGAAAFSTGFNSVNTDFDNDPADYAFSARIEALLEGSWRQFNYFSAPQGTESGLLLGAAAHYESGADRGDATDEPRLFGWTFDASYQGDGFNLFGAIIGRHLSKLPGSADDYGYVIQGGVFLSDDFEVFARWDHTLFDDALPNGDDDFKTITAGVNYYMHGHAAKLTTDIQLFLDNVPAGFRDTGVGLLAPSDDNQFAIRVQFQLLF